MKTIVVGVDGSECAGKALAWAVDEARLRGDRVRAVHAWEYPVNGAVYGMMGPQLGLDELRAAAKATLDEAVEPLQNGVPIEEVLVERAGGEGAHAGLRGRRPARRRLARARRFQAPAARVRLDVAASTIRAAPS